MDIWDDGHVGGGNGGRGGIVVIAMMTEKDHRYAKK